MTDPSSFVHGRRDDEILAHLAQLQAADLPTHGGRALAYVYDSGLAEADEVGRAALARFASANGLDPTAFPSLLQMENDLVALTGSLVDAPSGFVGSVTSGGTESILLAVLAARDARPDIERPTMVLPSTAHAAFHKAAHYYGVRAVVVPTSADPEQRHRADAVAMAAAIDDSTVLVVASAPSYAHGVVDPVPEIAAAARAAGVRCHVDACIGGWVLPHLARRREWTFLVPGVTSISVDLHKYAYTPKGVSVLLHRDATLRATQFYACADWPGYTMLNSTTQSTRSGGPLAAAWAVVQSIGIDRYAELATATHAATVDLASSIDLVEGLEVVAPPDSTLVAFTTTDPGLDVFSICDEMAARGWFVQPQLSHGDEAASLHLSLSAATVGSLDEFVDDLRAGVDAVRARGPIVIADDLAALVRGLVPEQMDEATFAGLVTAAGLAGTDGRLALPRQMGPVNALLDLAAPAVRERLLVTVLDQLMRPSAC